MLASTIESKAKQGSRDPGERSWFSEMKHPAFPGINFMFDWLGSDNLARDEQGRSMLGSLFLSYDSPDGKDVLSYTLFDSPDGLQADRYDVHYYSSFPDVYFAAGADVPAGFNPIGEVHDAGPATSAEVIAVADLASECEGTAGSSGDMGGGSGVPGGSGGYAGGGGVLG